MRMQEPDCEICGLSDDDSHPTKFTNHSCREVIEKPLRAKLHALESQLKQAKEWAGKAIANFGIYFERNPQTWLDDKKPLLVVAYDCVLKSRDALSDNAELKETHENP